MFRTLASLGFSSVSVCAYKMAGQLPALQQNWQSSEKSQHFQEKTQYLVNTLYIPREMLCGHSADIYLQGYMSALYPSSVFSSVKI